LKQSRTSFQTTVQKFLILNYSSPQHTIDYFLANLTGNYITSLKKLETGGFSWQNNMSLNLQAVGWNSSNLTSDDCAALVKKALVQVDCKNEYEFICEDLPPT
jgi:hypothetical protein